MNFEKINPKIINESKISYQAPSQVDPHSMVFFDLTLCLTCAFVPSVDPCLAPKSWDVEDSA